MEQQSAVDINKGRLDIRARGCWIRVQQALLDVRVFDPSAYSNQFLSQRYITNKKEKEATATNVICKQNKERILVEQALWYLLFMV